MKYALKRFRTVRLNVPGLDQLGLPAWWVATDASVSHMHNIGVIACAWGDGRARVAWVKRPPGRCGNAAWLLEDRAMRMALAPCPDRARVHLISDCASHLTAARAHTAPAGLVCHFARLAITTEYGPTTGASKRVPDHPLLAAAHRIAYAGVQAAGDGRYLDARAADLLAEVALRGRHNGRIKERYGAATRRLGIPPGPTARPRGTPAGTAA